MKIFNYLDATARIQYLTISCYRVILKRCGANINELISVRLRMHKTKECGPRIATLTMMLRLLLFAQKRWKKLRGYRKIEDVMSGVQFKDGLDGE